MSASHKLATCLVLLCATSAAVRADPEPPAVAAEAAYEDRLIDGGTLSADVSVGNATALHSTGWARSMRVEAIASRITRDGVDQDESGVRLNAMLDTQNWGAITLDANLRSSHGYRYGSGTGNLLTLYQIGLPMNGGWRVNNSLGVSNTPAVDLARNQQRFWVPSILNNGSATEWRRGGGLQLHGSIGQPGLLTGIYVPTFEDLGGEQFSAGAQWNGGGAWSAALQAVDVQDVELGLGPLNAAHSLSGYSALAAVAWDTPAVRVQLNAVNSTADPDADGMGAWLDTAVRQGRVRHTFGAFYFEPALYWGNQPLTSDNQGGYYRAAFQNRQWILDGGVDYLMPVSGESDDTFFGTGYARYQWSSLTGVGGGFNLRQNETEAWSVFGFVDRANRMGIGRGQADYATDDTRDRVQLTLNQTWNMPAGTRFGSSLIVGQERYLREDTTTYGVALNGGGDIRSNLTTDLNLRWDNADGRERSDNILASIALSWMFARGWTVGANYYVSRNTWRTPLTVTSPIDDLPAFEEQRIDDQGFYITLRHEWQAGSRSVPLAGAPGVGSGSVHGFLFLDENDNGRMDAGESGAPNVVVLLNGRFAARTNAEGRFEFPSVAAGEHVLSVVADNVPLPWTVPNEGRTTIEVGVRERVFVTLGAQRQR